MCRMNVTIPNVLEDRKDILLLLFIILCSRLSNINKGSNGEKVRTLVVHFFLRYKFKVVVCKGE